MGLLVLTRMVDERIFVGEDIVITVIAVRGDQVRIGIEAPRDVRIYREEVYDRIEREQGRRREGGGRR
jgi:carbon storage regulator